MSNEDPELDPSQTSVVMDPAPQQSELDRKINRLFPGVVVRKDLVKAVKGNAIVPTYVLEYLLGQYAASDDEATIQAGIDSVRRILADHYVHRNESELIKSTIREKGRHRIIDRVTVVLNEKADAYEASFENLGIRGVLIDASTVKAHEKLLVGGVWCICAIGYLHSEDARTVPWILESLKPIQMSSFDFDEFLAARKEFTSEEWVDLLIQTVGFNPELFGRRAKLLQLVRLVPFVERNYNLVELGPKGTGKSHIFSEFSPHGMLISGGEVTVPKLFVNNSNGKIGLVGYWDVVAFDEFAGRKKRADRALVDIMKNYMANKSFSRGIQTLGAEASMVFVGNTSHTVPYMLKNSDLFDELPDSYHDSAYLDRLHYYIPGWEADTIRSEMFSSGYGFVVDYVAEVLRHMRNSDFSDKYQPHFTLGSEISTRDRDAIHKTFSGLMKLVYPTGEASTEEIEELLRFAIEGRKRVKDQLLRIDTTMTQVKFGYTDLVGRWHSVTTLEEDEYPTYYSRKAAADDDQGGQRAATKVAAAVGSHDSDVFGTIGSGPIKHSHGSANGGSGEPSPDVPSAERNETRLPEEELPEGHRDFAENQRGVSYEEILLPYLRGATEIELHDPYIRLNHQGRNLAELLALIAVAKDPADEVHFKLFTTLHDETSHQAQQLQMLRQIVQTAAQEGIRLDIEKDPGGHDRWLHTDTGWRINLGRGLDIFQKSEGSWFDLGTSRQEFRQVRAFGVTYIKEKKDL
ncbi:MULTISPECIES: BREX system Lon protease-like protein BrxL [unclassified Actinobaculum]|uniref:BREX system Lon protease-like protein BrxL n=1 Tax=unclassified Actinobaculum TaxID=2609299 RepID=UPI000D52747E|nr:MULTISPECIES: BREX system Lon protease-like protein BrxL [unclassified Actinobaculum]AWE42792.1 BREX system Lon protease-like protein BrxL [Actinobaculum sp. 313]RTE49601.1 BREX system Lon protease-like protein BrxL [Actinobaculum sp. 352]